MSNKNRFGYVSFPKSALMVASGRMPAEKRPPKYFTKAVQNTLSLNDKNFFKALPDYIFSPTSGIDVNNIPQLSNSTVYDAGVFENMFTNNKVAFESFINFYIRYSKNIVVTFHEKKNIQNIIGINSKIIHVPYNDFYDRIDSIVDSIVDNSSELDYCIFDCPVLSSALASKVWSKTDMSILDFGKVFSITNRQ
jgi:hypothetical protein